MDDRTYRYLRGRFGDYYRHADSGDGLPYPPEHEDREWGFIPFTQSPGTTMVRHLSELEMGNVEEFLSRKKPQHVYFSASKYERPGAQTMEEKKWNSSDLIFDLDADPTHMETIDPEEDTYADMLQKCKKPLRNLVELLKKDFGFEDISVYFSGGRGYHVHVRDVSVQELGRTERSEIVNYVQGVGFDIGVFDEWRSDNVDTIYFTSSGWYQIVYQAVLELVDTLKDLSVDDGCDHLQKYNGVGTETAKTVREGLLGNEELLQAGHLSVGTKTVQNVIQQVAEDAIYENRSEIDEPVTTDINRLIRLPGSLHGGSALKVTEIDMDTLEDFDPLQDPIPDEFRGMEIKVKVKEETLVELDGKSKTYKEGEHSVPEYIGLFLMARGEAEKSQE